PATKNIHTLSLHDALPISIPGKSAIGIEVPNSEIATVSLREVLDVHKDPHKKLLFALGKDISGNIITGELNKMPHLLIAGATGRDRKSTRLNSSHVKISYA